MKLRQASVLAATIFTTLASAFACTDISSDPNTVLSLQFDSLPAPGVAVGDTLRDTLGAVARPTVHAFNFHGDEIVPASVFFLSPDTGVTVDSASGTIVADSLRSSPARIVANVGTLQAIQKPFFLGLRIQICRLTQVKFLGAPNICPASSSRDLLAAEPSPAGICRTRISRRSHFPIPAPTATSETAD